MINLIQGDCLERMKDIPDGSIDAVITSPPYAKQRNYTGFSPDDYSSFLLPIMKEVYRVLSSEGSLFINIKEHCEKGQRHLYVYKFVIEMVESNGWRFVDEFVWNKSNPFPTGSKKRLKDGWERIFHFTKTNQYSFYPERVMVKSESKWLEGQKRRSNKGAYQTNNGSGLQMKQRLVDEMVRPSNVISGATSCINIKHPAVFPIYLPEFFIKLTTKTNQTILDPFMGSGTTGVACVNLNRNFIGIELDEEYFKIAEERINKAKNEEPK